jgi:hypothetical protein
MVLCACAPGAVLVADDVADAEADVLVDDDVVPDLLSEPQPTSVKPSAAVAIAAVKYFVKCTSRKKMGRHLRRPRRTDTSRNDAKRCYVVSHPRIQ